MRAAVGHPGDTEARGAVGLERTAGSPWQRPQGESRGSSPRGRLQAHGSGSNRSPAQAGRPWVPGAATGVGRRRLHAQVHAGLERGATPNSMQ